MPKNIKKEEKTTKEITITTSSCQKVEVDSEITDPKDLVGIITITREILSQLFRLLSISIQEYPVGKSVYLKIVNLFSEDKKSKLRRNYYKRPKLPKPFTKPDDEGTNNKNSNLLAKP